MAAVSKRSNAFLSRFKSLLPLKTLYSKFVTVGKKPRSHSDKDYDLTMEGEIKVSKWKKMDSRVLGITPAMVPLPPYLVLKILKSRGFEAYLVGGCVRDLLLKRTPKDFDVITTADLNQIRKQFHRCVVVGHRFPVCRVHIKDSVIEVSSFKTLAKHSEGKEKFLVSQMPRGCDRTDLNLWKNSMHRDFTINSLFFDPLVNKIYDYTEGMKDLLDLKLRTLVPAHLSFTEDRARILRGLRIAARLGLSFSKDVEIAINKHALSILDLSKERLMMELNYMLSFGAAESSLSVLHRFHLLEALLPFQAAYISQQATRSDQSSTMLMKLFFHLDKLVTCDQPSDCRLWIGLLAFHMAIANNPQDPLVVLTFASVLYHQKWEEGLQFARQHGQAPISFEPEISGSYDCIISDDEVAKKVNQLANLAVSSIDVLVDRDNLHETMAKFPGYPFSDLVFISKKFGHGAAQIFHVLTHKVKTYKKGRTSFEVDLDLLGKGDSAETRFALGKIILNTMGCGVDQDSETIKDDYYSPSSFENGYERDKKKDKRQLRLPFDSELQEGSADKKQTLIANVTSTTKHSKKQNGEKDLLNVIADGNLLEQEESEEVTEKHAKVLGSSDREKEENAIGKPEEISEPQSSMKNLICLLETVIGDEKEEDKLVEDTDPESDQLVAEERRVKRKSRRKTKTPENSIGEKSPSQLESEKQQDKLVEDTNLEPDQLIAEEQRVKRKRRRKTKSLLISIGNEKSPSQLESEKQEDKLVEDTNLGPDQLIAEEQIVKRKRRRKTKSLVISIGNEKSPSQLESEKQEDKLVEGTNLEPDQLIAEEQRVKRKRGRKTKSLVISIGNEKSPSQLECQTQEDKLIVDTKLEADLLRAEEQIVERKRKKISRYFGTLIGNKKSPSRLESQKQEDKLVEDTEQEAYQLTAHKQSVKGKSKTKLAAPLSVLFK